MRCLSPVSIQTQSRALRKRKPQETQALALTSSQSWLPLLRPSIPIGYKRFLAVFVYATQAIAFEWKPGFRLVKLCVIIVRISAELLIVWCVWCVWKYSSQRREGIKALFEHFKPALIAYDEVNSCVYREMLLNSVECHLVLFNCLNYGCNS